VATAWLDLVPLSGAAVPPTVAGVGSPGPTVAGKPTAIGQMFRVDLGNGAVGHYLLTADGMAPLTDTEYLLQRARPGSTGETAITAADLAGTTRRTPVSPLTDLPGTPPKARSTQDGAAVCVEYDGRPDRGPTVVLTDPPAGDDGNLTVRVPPGGGALLLPHIDADPLRQQGVLVDERGIAYAVDATDITTLGYSPDQAVTMPPAMVALLPTGPALVRPQRR
jgi:hypothetical protein